MSVGLSEYMNTNKTNNNTNNNKRKLKKSVRVTLRIAALIIVAILSFFAIKTLEHESTIKFDNEIYRCYDGCIEELLSINKPSIIELYEINEAKKYAEGIERRKVELARIAEEQRIELARIAEEKRIIKQKHHEKLERQRLAEIERKRLATIEANRIAKLKVEALAEKSRVEKAEKAQQKKQVVVSRGSSSNVNTHVYEVTAYTAGVESTGKRKGDKGYGLTASGEYVQQGVTIACPKDFAFGTKVDIEGYGMRVCHDTGSAINSGKIDLYMDSVSAARKFGRQKLQVKIYR